VRGEPSETGNSTLRPRWESQPRHDEGLVRRWWRRVTGG
jgi:hypothetical protein